MRRIKKEKVINAIVYEFCLNNKYALTSGHQSLAEANAIQIKDDKKNRNGAAILRHGIPSTIPQ